MIRRPSQLTDREAVLKAIKECDRLGRDEFLQKYGFGRATGYFLRHDGKTYDSKAIAGVAFGYQYKRKPLASDEFSGGAARVEPVLKRLGFVIINIDMDDDSPAYSSEWLDVGEVYTREELREIFNITDATINNGVFRPKNSKSLWLFVTEKKAADRPQLIDRLDGNVLHWQGQPKGRTDQSIIDHLNNGDEVLLFYRDHRSQYDGSGFKYEGPFVYSSHNGTKPASFRLDRDIDSIRPRTTEDEEEFDPANLADGRKQMLALVRSRQGQGKFRDDLLKAYDGKCAVTGCSIKAILQAAHIHPYLGPETNKVVNGLLLRADIHTLFDLGMIKLNDDGSLIISKRLAGTEYAKLKAAKLPKESNKRPSPKALAKHRELKEPA